MDDLISREETLTAFADYVGSGMSMNDYDALWDIVAKMPSVNPQASKEDIHREREQAYMKGYEDASKRYRTEPCDDAISRTDAIRVASGYCHWTNIPDELAKLPSVNTIPCGDAISRQEVLEGLARIAKAKARSDAQKAIMGRTMFFVDQLPSVCTEKTGRWEWVQYDSNPSIGNWHCSECNRIVCGAITAANPVYSYKYCPNCGCRMMEVEE